MEILQKRKKLDFKVDGLEKDGGTVRLAVFRDKLDQLTRLVADAERQSAHVKQAKSLFRLSDLKHSSAYIQLESFVEDGYEGSVKAIDLLNHVLEEIDSQVDSLNDIDSSLVKKIVDLCSGAGDKFHTQTIAFDGKQFVLDTNMASKAQKYLDRKFTAYGEIKGRIERVNIHDRHDFYLYLEITGSSVECHFKEEKLLQSVKDALGKTVIASGLLQYIGHDIEPTVATIDAIDIIPKGYKTPALEDLLGIAPNLTGDMDIEDYIRNIRGEWGQH